MNPNALSLSHSEPQLKLEFEFEFFAWQSFNLWWLFFFHCCLVLFFRKNSVCSLLRIVNQIKSGWKECTRAFYHRRIRFLTNGQNIAHTFILKCNKWMKIELKCVRKIKWNMQIEPINSIPQMYLRVI